MNASCTLVTAVQTLALPIFTLISSSSNETRGSFDLVRDPSPRRAAWTPDQACPELVERFGVTRKKKPRLTRQRLLPPPLHRRSITHRLAIFDHGAPRDVVALGREFLRDRLIRQNRLAILGLDHRLDPALHRPGDRKSVW